jgi:ribosomal protein S14
MGEQTERVVKSNEHRNKIKRKKETAHKGRTDGLVTALALCRLILERSVDLVSAGTLAILIKILRGFPKSLLPNAKVLPQLGWNCFHPNPFTFIIHPSY